MPDVPAPQWTLSERGIEEAEALARIAAAWGLQAIYSSPEPRTRATGLILAEAAGLIVNVVDGFEELRFGEWIPNADQFSELVRRILEHADASSRGAERASAAAARFAAGVAIVEQGPFPAAIVSHGRVLAAYLAELLRLEDAFALWRSIPMPGWACLDLEGARPRLIRRFDGVTEA